MRLGDASDVTGLGVLATSPHPTILAVPWREPGFLCVLHPERGDTLLAVLRAVQAAARAGYPHIVVTLPGLSAAFRQPGRRWRQLQWLWFLANAQLVRFLAYGRPQRGGDLSFVVHGQPYLVRLASHFGFDVYPSFAHLVLAFAGPPPPPVQPWRAACSPDSAVGEWLLQHHT